MPNAIKNTPKAFSLQAWEKTAFGLKHAADIIWDKWFSIITAPMRPYRVNKENNEVIGVELSNFLPLYMMLYGLAFENLLKGLLVFKNPEKYKDNIKWENMKGGHDLIKLFNNIDFKLSDEEIHIMKSLTDAVMWAGRYPVPKNHDNKISIGYSIGLNMQNLTDQNIHLEFAKHKNICDDLYNRLKEKCDQSDT